MASETQIGQLVIDLKIKTEALEKGLETAKKKSEDGQSDKQVQERTYRFMSALAGDLTGYEEALRALYKKDHKVFFAQTQSWPKDIRNFAHALSQSIFE